MAEKIIGHSAAFVVQLSTFPYFRPRLKALEKGVVSLPKAKGGYASLCAFAPLINARKAKPTGSATSVS